MEVITRKYTIYKLSELPEDAKQKALESLYDINVNYDDWNEPVKEDLIEDLKKIGIEFDKVYYDLDRRYWYAYLDKPKIINSSLFLKSAGIDLRTKEAKETIEHILIDTKHYGGGQAKNIILGGHTEIDEKLEALFNDKIEDFLTDSEKNYEYLTSEKFIIETIECNDYDFTEDGKLFS